MTMPAKRHMCRVGLACLGVFLALGCEEAPATEGGGAADNATATLAAEGPPAVESMRTVEVSAELATQGAELFTPCAACHGDAGEGKPNLGPRLASRSFLAAASDEFLINTITNGRAGTTMAGFTFEDAQMNQLISHIRSLAESEPATLDEAALSGDADAGEPIFADICASCHGISGEGITPSNSGTGIGRAGFLATATNGYLRYIIRNGKSDTAMRGFQHDNLTALANLTDEEIENIIVYMRARAY